MHDEASPAAGAPLRPSLLRSGAFGLVTSAAPLIVALAALPVLTRVLGAERLGLLALAWAWLGYAALLDFGLGRALTRLVAASDAGELLEAPIGAFVNTAHRMLVLVGTAVGLAGALLAPWYVTRVLGVSADLRSDALVSAILFAMTVPAVTGASAPRAVLEARHRFRDVNLVRLPVSVGTFAVPLLLLPITASLTVIAATLSVVRVWAWWRYTKLARTEIPRRGSDAPAVAGAWMTVSNVLSPLMTFADRFLIGSLVSVSAVALYAVPWEAVTKLWIVPGALTMVLFPALARLHASAPEQVAVLNTASVRLMTVLVVPVCAIACLLAPWLLRVAGGAQYAGASVTVLRILAIGVAANCIAAVPFTLLQASGRARTTAMLHLIEIMPFALLLWFAVTRYGIVGAAAAWTTRVVIDAALLAWRAQAIAPLPASTLILGTSGVATVAASAWIGTTAAESSRLPLVAACLLGLAIPVALWSQRNSAERLVLERVGGTA